MDKTFDIVGVSTQGKITKFRVANGDMAARAKVLERNGHTEINLIKLPAAVSKDAAIAAYTAQFPDAANIRQPNEKDAKPAKANAKPKTVTIKKAAGKGAQATPDVTADAAAALLNAIAADAAEADGEAKAENAPATGEVPVVLENATAATEVPAAA